MARKKATRRRRSRKVGEVGRGIGSDGRRPRRLSLQRMEPRLALSADAIATAQNTLFADSVDPQPNIRFGHAVTIADDFLAVSESIDPDILSFRPPASAGRVRVFDAETGVQLHTLTSPRGGEFDRFGGSLVASGELLVVADSSDVYGGIRAGSAFVYDGVTGQLVATLEDPTPYNDGRFGSAVDLSDGLVAVGNQERYSGRREYSEVHIFDADSGTLVVTINDPAPHHDSEFGSSVAIGDGVVAVGDSQDGANGAVYLFDAVSGELLDAIVGPSLALAPLEPPDPTHIADRFEFGGVVDVDNGLLVVGNTATTSRRLGYVYDLTTRELVSTLTASSSHAHRDRITTGSISISGNVVVVGQNTTAAGKGTFEPEFSELSSPAAAASDAEDGLVHVFHARTGDLLATLDDWSSRLGDIEDQVNSSSAVDVWADRIVTGFSEDNTASFDHGSATIWQLGGSPRIVSLGGLESPTVRVAENTSDVVQVQAVSTNLAAELTYSIIDGEDQDLFQIDSDSGQVRFVSPPDYELPLDVDENNRYQVTVEALDIVSGLADSQHLTVQVRDRDEAIATDDVAPEVVSIERRLPTTETMRAETATFRVTFNESIQFPAVDHFVVSFGSIESVSFSSRETGRNSFDVHVVGLTGLSGELALSLDPTNAVVDTSGNAMSIFTPTVSSESFTLDRELPVEATGFVRSFEQGHFSVDTIGEVIDVGDRLTVVGDRFREMVHVYDRSGRLVRTYLNPQSHLAGGKYAFGIDVATSGSLVVVGSPFDDLNVGNIDAGMAYVYDVNSPSDQPVASISHPSPVAGNKFGSLVDISGGNIIVGSAGDASVHAYTFANGTIDFATTLQFVGGGPGQSSPFLGDRIEIEGDTVIVSNGSLYEFDLASPTPEIAVRRFENLVPENTSPFGGAIAYHDGILAMTSVVDNVDEDVVVFDLGSETPETPIWRIEDPFPETTTGFGRALDVSDGAIVVGAPLDDQDHNRGGRTYIYHIGASDRDTPWMVLAPPDPRFNGGFGYSTAIAGDRLAVSAYWHYPVEPELFRDGNVYTFNLASPDPNEFVRLRDPFTALATVFGDSVDLDDRRLAIADRLSGKVQIHDTEDPSGPPTHILQGPPTSVGRWVYPSVAISGDTFAVGAFNSLGPLRIDVHDLSSSAPLVPNLRFEPAGALGGPYAFGYDVKVSGNFIATYDPFTTYATSGSSRDNGVIFAYDTNGDDPTRRFMELTRPTPQSRFDPDQWRFDLDGNLLVAYAVGHTEAFVYDLTSPTPEDPVMELHHPDGSWLGRGFGLPSIDDHTIAVLTRADVGLPEDVPVMLVYDLLAPDPQTPVHTIDVSDFGPFDGEIRNAALDSNRLVVQLTDESDPQRPQSELVVLGVSSSDSVNLLATVADPLPDDPYVMGVNLAVSGNQIAATLITRPYAFDEFGTVAVFELDANLPPEITSDGGSYSAEIEIDENESLVTTVTAEDFDSMLPIAYSIDGGADAALFQIDPGTGELNFIEPPDFENPLDVNVDNPFQGGDNVYEVIVAASDGQPGGTDRQLIEVTVEDVDEPLNLASIRRQLPSIETIRSESATFRVTFSESVQNIDTSDFAASFGFVDSVAESTFAVSRIFDVTVSGLSDVTGELRLAIASTSDITDSAGIAIGERAPTIASESFQLDGDAAAVALDYLFPPDADPPQTTSFGKDVASNDRFRVVADTDFGPSHVHVYDASTNELIVSLPNPDDFYFSAFGSSIELSGSRIAVYGVGDASGKTTLVPLIYVYDMDSSAPDLPLAELRHPSDDAGVSFGRPFAFDGNTIVAQSYISDEDAFEQEFFVFDLESADPETPVTVFRLPASLNALASAIAIDVETIAIGTASAYSGASRSGSAHLLNFDGETVTFIGTIDNPDPDSDDHFGYSIAISNNKLVVGSDETGIGSPRVEQAFVFDLSTVTPTLLATLDNPTPDTETGFGNAVAIDGESIVVGAPEEDVEGLTKAGEVHVYRLEAAGASYVTTIADPDAGDYQEFGASVSIFDTELFVGRDRFSLDRLNKAYVFDLDSSTPSVPTGSVTDPAMSENRFGAAVALSENYAVVSQLWPSKFQRDGGEVNVYDISSGFGWRRDRTAEPEPELRHRV